MNELIYFSGMDLMIKVKRAKKANTLHYVSHREMEHKEKVMAEHYMRAKMISTSGRNGDRPSIFIYRGTDNRLKRKLTSLHAKHGVHRPHRKEREITASVKNLINIAMRNYYTENIGELLVRARNELRDGMPQEGRLALLKQQLQELVLAYNAYADHKIILEEIIPAELKPFWLGLKDARLFVAASR